MSVKAFDLIPIIDRGKLLPNQKSQVTCLECCGKNLYIGTDDSILAHYTLEEVPSQNGRTSYRVQRHEAKSFQIRKPICQLKAASALNRILMLCDNNIVLLDMLHVQVVSGAGRVKGVSAFCLNENPANGDPFSVEICTISRKRCLQLFSIKEDKVTLVKDISLTDPPVTMSIDGSFVCVATTSEYKMVNVATGATQELFPYDPEQMTPVITRISREEFLLSAGSLGMFATTTGISQRPPLQWNNNITAVTYTHPYILTLNDEFITVHSILDQQQKQSVPFSGGRLLGEYDGKILVTRERDLYALAPIAVERQIQALLSDKRVKEALELAKNATKIGFSREKFQKMYERIQQQAGFIELVEGHFDEASELFLAGQLDVRELLVLFPGLLGAHSGFVKSVPPLHEIVDVVMLTRARPERLESYKHFLVDYLERVQPLYNAKAHRQEIDTALLKLYAEFSSHKLVSLIESSPHVRVEEVQAALQKYDKHHALALLCERRGDQTRALQIWTDLVDGKCNDPTFPGFQFVVQYLAKVEDAELVWQYADWALQRDQEEGVKIFTARQTHADEDARLLPEVVVDFLSKYPRACVLYLQHLVHERNLQSEKLHTHLAMLYLDRVNELRAQEPVNQQQLDSARRELKEHLERSDLYRTQLLLSRLQNTDMHAELAVLYGKLGEHDKALRLLVHELGDHVAAEHYCHVTSGDHGVRTRLFHTLLNIYLDPSLRKAEFFVAPALNLLNNNKACFDALKVVETLPQHWSVGLLSHFLCCAVRRSTHARRMNQTNCALSRGHVTQLSAARVRATQHPFLLKDNRKCMVCKKPFTEAAFTRYPNGVIAHIDCCPYPTVCPVTGRNFTDQPQELAVNHPQTASHHQKRSNATLKKS